MNHDVMTPLFYCRSNFTMVPARLVQVMENKQYTGRRVGLGCALTMTHVPNLTNATVIKNKSPFFTHLLPTFCKTASQNFNYTFFIGYDFDDRFLSRFENRNTFIEIFDSIRKQRCTRDFEVHLQFVRCNHTGKPARAQNDALMAGYFAGMDYLYMVNDDTLMQTNDWTPRFIHELAKFSPPNVGLVGPTHSGGSTKLLTYNFVHRTHVDIFKCFYPRNFTDWWADRWISEIYKPNNVLKVPEVKLNHSMVLGRRYQVNWALDGILQPLIDKYRKILRSYLEARGIEWNQWTMVKNKKSKL